jgi:hypothetical protein
MVMETSDEMVDVYIAKAQRFAQPILKHLRKLIHQACPDVVEKIKWSFPNFEYEGSIMCNMAAFNQHCTFGFWKAAIMKDPQGFFSKGSKRTLGHFEQIKDLKDQEAAKLNKDGRNLPSRNKNNGGKELSVPSYFLKALDKNKKALKTFDDFSYSNKREYVEWVSESKTEETRLRRLLTSIEWLPKVRSEIGSILKNNAIHQNKKEPCN